MTKHSSRKTVLWLLFAALFLAAAMIVIVDQDMLTWWPSRRWPYSFAVPFATPDLTGATELWTSVAGWEVAWSIALIFIVAALLKTPYPWARRSGAVIIAAQATLVLVVFFAPLPFNSDQYVYVAYGDLIDSGDNPYDPPLKSAVVSRPLHDIATVWGTVNEGAANATKRVVLRDRYGPAWTLGVGVILFPFHNLSVTVQAHVLRAIAALVLVVSSTLLWFALATIPWRSAAVAAFALNPLTIMQAALGGHNDIVALALAITAYIAASRRNFALGGIGAGLSIATKLTFLPYLLPLVAYAFGSRKWRGAAHVALTTALVLIASSVPFGGLRAIFQPIDDASKYNQSYVTDLLQRFIERHLAAHSVSVYHFYVVAMIVVAVGVAYRALRFERLPLLEAIMALLIMCAAHFEPWYGYSATPLLFIPRRWALSLFISASLAFQLLERKNFIGGYNALPFLPFVALMLGLVVVTMILFRGPTRRSIPEMQAP
jgi:hypothetical protein